MKKLLTVIAMVCCASAQAQVTSCASFLEAQQRNDVVVPFRYDDPGYETPMWWGMDMAWISEDNLRTGVFFAGQDVIDYVRLSYQATASVEGGSFSDDQLSALEARATPVLKWCKAGIGYYLEDDNPTEDPWYYDTSVSSYERALRWAKVIDMTVDYYSQKGLGDPVSIGPFNEPDYAWQSGDTQNDLVNICYALRNEDAYKDKYAGTRLYGPSCLNPDYALSWWGWMGSSFDEGNTHQLAGTFDSYASFFQTLKAEGKYGCSDELHNVMECMIGAHYGAQTGIWWGTAEYARSQFMKATTHTNPGSCLAYAEHRGNWTAASVYRHASGQVQAFIGESERQATTTAYSLISLDRPVWYDGQRGRECLVNMRGGSGYMTDDQPYLEQCVNVEASPDVMPHIDGTYKIVNEYSGLILSPGTSAKGGYYTVTQRKNANYSYSRWVVTPLRYTGDQSYYSITLGNDAGMQLDVLNWGYEQGTDVGVYPGVLGTNEQWYLEYAGGGAFYIRCRSAAKCLEIAKESTVTGINVEIGDFTGEKTQRWRFIGSDVTPEFDAPSAPSNLRTTLQGASIRLTWEASPSDDVREYCVVRNGSLLARGITGCEFTDNEAEPDSTYSYYVYALDKCLNQSPSSNVSEGNSITDEPGLVMRLAFDDSLLDETENGNHCALYGDTTFVTNSKHKALSLSGTDNFVQLPYTVASHDALTVSCWLRCGGISQWQRVFDFGNGTDQYLFLTVKADSGPRFAIKDGGDEQQVDASSTLIAGRWYHLAVTLGDGKARLYINGELKGENESVTIRPSDFRPVLNYIGRSQYSADPLLKGYVDDFRVYNYALTAEEVAELTTGIETVQPDERQADTREYDLSGRRAAKGERGIIITGGKKVLR